MNLEGKYESDIAETGETGVAGILAPYANEGSLSD